ncbi:glycosyltransferase [Rhodobacteraceae bacterium D3-12]|nr:glycosyltransferase [Rhodobacteraceae bacterium D3-12]
MVDHSLPYSSDGYAVRTHEIARALKSAGHDIIVFNRPGRPWDIEGFDPTVKVKTEQVIDGVRYVFLPGRYQPGVTPRARIRIAENVLVEAFETYRPGIVLGVSNWENAEPVQYAARRWGVPFFYEQRGFWEMSRAALEPGYEDSEDYNRNRDNDLRIAKAARAVFTLNQSMRDELVRRGLPADKIHLVPNGVSTPGPIPKGVSRADIGCSSRFLLGYIGSLSGYEGSSDLIPLLKRLRSKDIDVDLAIIGSSAPKGLIGSAYETPTETRLHTEAKAEGLESHVHFVPQVSQDKIGAYYGLLDAMIMPRHRSIVTELVAPLKPYTAASFGVPVFMTDMPPLDEIARDIHASLFTQGDLDGLADMVADTLLHGGHPSTMNSLKSSIHWTRRVAPMSRLLTAAMQEHPPIAEMLDMGAAVGPSVGTEAAATGFDVRILPQVAMHSGRANEQVVAIGPATHETGANVIRATRSSLLANLAVGAPGRFVIDWAGLQTDPQEWAGLWSINTMRLNRQIMDACRIARDRGWKIEVLGPVARSRAPLFRTVAGLVEEIEASASSEQTTETAGVPDA